MKIEGKLYEEYPRFAHAGDERALVIRFEPVPGLKCTLRSVVSTDLAADAQAFESMVKFRIYDWLERNFVDLERGLVRYRPVPTTDIWSYRLTYVVDDKPLYVERDQQTPPFVRDAQVLMVVRADLTRRWHLAHCTRETCGVEAMAPICPKA